MDRTYQIIDNGGVGGYHPHGPVGKPYKNAKRARSRAERLNLEYGAHRYSVRTIYADAPSAPASGLYRVRLNGESAETAYYTHDGAASPMLAHAGQWTRDVAEIHARKLRSDGIAAEAIAA